MGAAGWLLAVGGGRQVFVAVVGRTAARGTLRRAAAHGPAADRRGWRRTAGAAGAWARPAGCWPRVAAARCSSPSWGARRRAAGGCTRPASGLVRVAARRGRLGGAGRLLAVGGGRWQLVAVVGRVAARGGRLHAAGSRLGARGGAPRVPRRGRQAAGRGLQRLAARIRGASLGGLWHQAAACCSARPAGCCPSVVAAGSLSPSHSTRGTTAAHGGRVRAAGSSGGCWRRERAACVVVAGWSSPSRGGPRGVTARAWWLCAAGSGRCLVVAVVLFFSRGRRWVLVVVGVKRQVHAKGDMDEMSSAVDAVRMLGLSAKHPLVYLARVLQQTCEQVEDCTDRDVLISVTLSRAGMPSGILLFASGYLDPRVSVTPSAQAVAQVAVGLDSLVTALRHLHVEREERAAATTAPFESAADATVNEDGDEEPLDGGFDDSGNDCDEMELLARSAAGSEVAADTPLEGSFGVTPLASPPTASVLAGATPAGTSPRRRPPGLPPRPPSSPSRLPRGSPPLPPPPRGATPQRSPPLRSASPDGRISGGASAARTAVDGVSYVLPATFSVPGLSAPPARMQMTPGRRLVKVPTRASDDVVVQIPRSAVEETVKELMVPGRDDSLRVRLLEFQALYKFIIDTLVRRACPDAVAREKINHPFIDVTPDAVRGKTVVFTMTSGKRMSLTCPTFMNTRAMTTGNTLAVILLMKHLGDPFFLWVLGIFSGGAMAPPDVLGATQGGVGRGKKQKGGPSAGVRRSASPRPGTDKRPRLSPLPGEGSSTGPAKQSPVNTSADLIERLTAGSLLINGEIVASAEVHPEFDLFHFRTAPSSVLTVFLRDVAVNAGAAVYPFGQDEHLCLEKGNPSSSPVLLSGIERSYRLAWPVADVRPRVRLFDRPPAEADAVLLATACIWRAASPSVPDGMSSAEVEQQLRNFQTHMPAVEVFAVLCEGEHAASYYPFTTAFYESVAYKKYRKHHCSDYILPKKIGDIPGAAGKDPQRSVVLWDSRFVAE